MVVKRETSSRLRDDRSAWHAGVITNREQVRGKGKPMKGAIKARWRAFTVEEVGRVGGESDRPVGPIGENTVSRNKTRRQVDRLSS